MPVDENGNRADVIMDGGSTVSRMNMGRLFEHYIASAARDVQYKIRDILRDLVLEPEQRHIFNVTFDAAMRTKINSTWEALKVSKLDVIMKNLETTNPDVVDKAWQYLMGFYNIVSPNRMHVWFTSGEYKKPRSHHLAEVLAKGVYLYMPPENEPEIQDILTTLEALYRPTYGPVKYRGYSGREVMTKSPVRIGSMYMLLLEKIGDDWTAVSSGKLQHLGVLSQVTSADKFTTPTRSQPVRIWGESEVRIAVSFIGPKTTADILDRSNNPATHRQILMNLLAAEKPTDVDYLVDRSVVPLGGSRALALVKHMAECNGYRFCYEPYKPGWEYKPDPNE